MASGYFSSDIQSPKEAVTAKALLQIIGESKIP